MNGYNFTERVRKVLALSREEAVGLHHEYVGTEHLLLGLVREGEGVASTVLADLGVDGDALRDQLISTLKLGKSPRTTAEADLPYTSRAKKVLELSMKEARELHHSYVGTEHLLLGLIAEAKGIAAQVLYDQGCTLEKTRAATLRLLGTEIDDAPKRERLPIPRRVPHSGRQSAEAADYPGVGAPRHFSARVISVVSAANLQAVSRKNKKVDADHVLIALLAYGEGMAIAVLERLGADIKQLRQTVDLGRQASDEPAGPETPLDMSELSAVLELAESERARSDAPLVATHHLLLAAITRSPRVRDVFANAGITEVQIRAEASRMSG
jgi:ATP-dependent Clp protease ATP-binding subunit ClpA